MKKVSILSPSYYCSENELIDAKKNLRELGFDEILDFTSREKLFGKWAGSFDERLNSFYNAWNGDSSPIVCCKGGSGLSHFLPYVNKDLLRKRKMFVGYSDITFLLNFISSKLGVITVHGPNALKPIDSETRDSLINAMGMLDYGIDISKKEFVNFSSSEVVGKTIGGNLDRLVESLQWVDLDFRDKIVFLEEVGHTEHKIFNLLNSLKNHSLFKPKAIVFGDLSVKDNKLMKKMIKYLFPDLPIIFDLPFGHSLPNISIPIGVDCRIDLIKNTVNFMFREYERYYAVPVEGKDFYRDRIYSSKIGHLDISFDKKRSVSSMLKYYKPKNLVSAKRFRISGLRDKEILHLSSPVKINGQSYIVAEISDYNSSDSVSVLLRKVSNSWVLENENFGYGLSRAKLFKTSKGIVLVGRESSAFVLYLGDDLYSLRKVHSYSDKIKNLSFIEVNGRLGVFVSIGNYVKYSQFLSFEDMYEKNLMNAKRIVGFANGEWGAVVDSVLLKNGKLGVLGYLARKMQFSKNYFYYPFVFCLNPKTFETSSIRVLLRRGELPEGECRSPEFYNVILPGGIVRRNNYARMYVSVGNFEGYFVKLIDPFSYYEKYF